MEWPWSKAKTADTSATDGLVRALEDADPEVCCRAADQAGKERNRAAVLPLVKLLYTDNEHPGSKRIITAAARALGEIGDLRAIQHLEEAGFAHVYGGPPTVVDYIYADGRMVSPEEQDVLMDEAIREAEKKLWAQPGAEVYLARLGRIKMYSFIDFWHSNDIYIHPDLERQPDPFDVEVAKLFFANFKGCRFGFEREARSIVIRRGKAIPPDGLRPGQPPQQWPRHSYADGQLYGQSLDEVSKLGLSAVTEVGKIHFEYGGNARAPYMQVPPEPEWPSPSIVRRCVLDGGTGIRFEEID